MSKSNLQKRLQNLQSFVERMDTKATSRELIDIFSSTQLGKYEDYKKSLSSVFQTKSDDSWKFKLQVLCDVSQRSEGTLVPNRVLRCFPQQSEFPAELKQLVSECRRFVETGTYAQMSHMFHLNLSPTEYKSICRELMKSKDFSSIVDFVTKNDLFSIFTPDEIIIPLSKARKYGDIRNLLVHLSKKESEDDKKRFQVWFPKAVDSLADPKVGDSPTSSIKLLKDFDVSMDEYPRVEFLQRKKVILWCISIKQIQEFEEYLLNGSSDDRQLQIFTCRQIFRYDYVLFNELVHKYGLQEHPEFVNRIDLHKAHLAETSSMNIDDSFLVSNNLEVMFVDSLETLRTSRDTLLSSTRVGLDMENIPGNIAVYASGMKSACQILQLSTETHGFIYDFQRTELHEEYNKVLGTLFKSDKILKIGMDFRNDMREMSRDFPDMSCFKKKMGSYLELADVLKTIRENAPPTKRKVSREERGLAKICSHFLGKKLNKKYQISNWGRRPLLPGQIEYAILDAYVCILIHDQLKDHE